MPDTRFKLRAAAHVVLVRDETQDFLMDRTACPPDTSKTMSK